MKKFLYLAILLANSAMAMEKNDIIMEEPETLIQNDAKRFFPTHYGIDLNARPATDTPITIVIETALGSKTDSVTGATTPMIAHCVFLKSDDREIITIGDVKAQLAQEEILPHNTLLYIKHDAGKGRRRFDKYEIAPDITRLCDIAERCDGGEVKLTPFKFNSLPFSYTGRVTLTRHSLDKAPPYVAQHFPKLQTEGKLE